MNESNRREFLKFMGQTGALVGASSVLSACQSMYKSTHGNLLPLMPKSDDDLILSAGLNYKVLVQWGDTINKSGQRFGYNNDYIALVDEKDDEALMWVNHEYPNAMFVSGYTEGVARTKDQVVEEQKSVGGSILKIRKNLSGDWSIILDASENRRVDGTTPIDIVSPRKIAGSKTAIGTTANCAGGVTPWGNILTCEENFYKFYGDSYFKKGEKVHKSGEKYFYWDRFFDYPPEHYGWVVEVNPRNGRAKKHTSMGRFAHECATVTRAKDGRVVVYSGDDKKDECLYKFISDSKNDLTKGELYVANLKDGKWVHLSLKKAPQLSKYFKDQTELLTHVRTAAHELGGSKLARPEDVAVQPNTGNVFVALTNNKKRKNYHGSILKIVEQNGDAGALYFESSTYIPGGKKSGFSCPDNFAFDPKGNLWLTTDISEKAIGKSPYVEFKNNGLFYIPLKGPGAGKAIQVASAPVDAELTGPCFSKDGKTLFLSVQHPGAQSKSLNPEDFTSHWPGGGKSQPKPAVVAISGETLNDLMS